VISVAGRSRIRPARLALTTDLNKIQIIGDSVESCRKEYKMAPRFLKMRRQEKKELYQTLAVDI
jgi:hypothetical protein